MEQWTQIYLGKALENTTIKLQREKERDRNKQDGSRSQFLTILEHLLKSKLVNGDIIEIVYSYSMLSITSILDEILNVNESY
ncbi:MAG: hypothetical protein L0H55_11945 [Candidatus Nitrosocosmicus sp.]|nr:hypothetical protein [Candidatus Nitrosocosmicus sp.]